MQIFQCTLNGLERPCAPRDCQRCHGQQKLHRHGSYERNSHCTGEAKATVARFLCPRCGATFSVIPEGMFPYRSLPVERFEFWMDGLFKGPVRASAGDGARPPPATEVEKGCLLRALARLQGRMALLCGLLGQQMPLLEGDDIGGFWPALRKIGSLGNILAFLAQAFKTSLLADYHSLKPPWEREICPEHL